MKIYRVVMEGMHGDNLTRETQDVSAHSVKEVTKHFSRVAKEIDMELLSVHYLLTVVQHLGEK